MPFVNLTPHVINVVDGPAFPPSGAVARVKSTTEVAGTVDGVALYRVAFGAVEGLPAEVPGTILIVSALVRGAVPARRDVASPGELVRGADGNPVGCRGLAING